MGFNLVNLAITLRAEDASRFCICFPLLGKEYAAACRNLSCNCSDRVCETCSIQETCDWFLVFGQKLTSDPAALKRHQKPPLPFVFSFPMSDVLSENQKVIVCGLIVIGRAITCLEMLLNGFSDLLSCGNSQVSAEIIQIACRDYQDTIQSSFVDNGFIHHRKLVPENLVIVSSDGLVESRPWAGAELHIRLMSPLRVFEDSRPVVCFEFRRFALSVMRRVSALAFYYGESEFGCDFKELTRQVDDVICTDEHFCYTKDNARKLSGIIGSGSFIGDFSQLMQFIIIGSYVHIGKGSSFGMGAYEVLPDDCGKVVPPVLM